MQDNGEIYLSFIEKRGWGGGGVGKFLYIETSIKKKKTDFDQFEKEEWQEGREISLMKLKRVFPTKIFAISYSWQNL